MLYNREYGRLVDNNLEYAPRNVEIDNTWYIPAGEEQFLQAGYYPIENTFYPQDGKIYSSSWELRDNKIVQVWMEIPEPPDTRIPAEKREEQYETKECIVYNGDVVTIDEAVKLVYEYSCENTETANELVEDLKEQITTQKAIIRREYPNEE